MKKITTSEKQTFELAKEFAANLQGGEVIALYGDLGAGKTVFVRGLAAGLGVKEIVKSPTFVIMKCYLGKKLNLCHIDAYRLSRGAELAAIGALDFWGKKNTVSIIEWADRVPELLNGVKNLIKIRIEHLGQDKRKISFPLL
jgi:tRNA threonylcarbamoyladenosine biosynthesis protein TsaE